MSRKIVITGIGTVNPLANDAPTTWARIKNGENGIGPITKFDVNQGLFSTFPTKIAGEVRGLDMSKYVEKKEARRMDAFIQYAMAASLQAMEDAGLKAGDYDPERISVIFGNGIGGIETLEDNIVKLHNKGIDGIHPLLIPKMIINEGPGMVAIKLNAQGPSYGIVTACSSATDAIGIAMELIRKGWIDIAVTGGTEAPITPLGVGGFCVLQAVSSPQRRPRARQPPLRQGPRRLCRRRRRRRRRDRGRGAREKARREDLLRDGRLRRHLRRQPHHGAPTPRGSARPGR